MTAAAITLGIAGGAAQAVIVDRIAVTVGGKIITDSEIRQRLLLTAFQNHEKADISEAARAKAASMLIDQKLIEREMDVGRYPTLTEDKERLLVQEFAKSEYKGSSSALAKALTGYGLTMKDFEAELGRQSDLLTFLNLRFRPAVEVTDEDVTKYLDQQKGAAQTPKEAQQGALNEMRESIRDKLTTERADKELDTWLSDQRKTTKIVYLEKDLQAETK